MEDLVQSLFNESGAEGQYTGTTTVDEVPGSSVLSTNPTMSSSQTQWCQACANLAKDIEDKYTRSFVAIKQKIFFTDNLIQMYQTCKKQLEENTEKLNQTTKDRHLIQSQLELLLSKEEPSFTETANLRNEVITLKETIESLKAQLHGMDESRRIHEESIKILKAEDTGMVFELKKKHRKEITDLRDELSEKSSMNKKLKKRNRNLRDTISKLRESKNRIRRISKSLSKDGSTKNITMSSDAEMKSSNDQDESMNFYQNEESNLSMGSDVTSSQINPTNLDNTVFEVPRRSHRISSNKDQKQEKVAYITSTTDDSADEMIIDNSKPQDIADDVVSSTSVLPHVSENKKKLYKDRMMEMKRKRAITSFRRRPTQNQLLELHELAITWKDKFTNESSFGKEKSFEHLMAYVSEFCEKQFLQTYETLVINKLYKLHKGMFSEEQQSWLHSLINSLPETYLSTSEHCASDGDRKTKPMDMPECHVSSTQKVTSPDVSPRESSCSSLFNVSKKTHKVDEITNKDNHTKLSNSTATVISLSDDIKTSNIDGKALDKTSESPIVDLTLIDSDSEVTNLEDKQKTQKRNFKISKMSGNNKNKVQRKNIKIPVTASTYNQDNFIDVESLSDEAENSEIDKNSSSQVDSINSPKADNSALITIENNSSQVLVSSDNDEPVEDYVSEMPDISDIGESQVTKKKTVEHISEMPVIENIINSDEHNTNENRQNEIENFKNTSHNDDINLTEIQTPKNSEIRQAELSVDEEMGTTLSLEKDMETCTENLKSQDTKSLSEKDVDDTNINIVHHKPRISRVETGSTQVHDKNKNIINDNCVEERPKRKRKNSSSSSERSRPKKVQKFQEPTALPPVISTRSRTRSITTDSSSDHEITLPVPSSPLRRSGRIGSRNRTTSSSSESSKDGAKALQRQKKIKDTKSVKQRNNKSVAIKKEEKLINKKKNYQKTLSDKNFEINELDTLDMQKDLICEISSDLRPIHNNKQSNSKDENTIPQIVEDLVYLESPMSTSSSEFGDQDISSLTDLNKWHCSVNKIMKQMTFDVGNAISPLPTTPLGDEFIDHEEESLDVGQTEKEKTSNNIEEEIMKLPESIDLNLNTPDSAKCDDSISQVDEVEKIGEAEKEEQSISNSEIVASSENPPINVNITDSAKGRDSISPSTVLCTAINFGTPSKDFSKNTLDIDKIASIENSLKPPVIKIASVLRSPSSLSDDIILKSSADQPSCSKALLFGTGSVAKDILKPRRFSCEAPERAVNVRPIKPIVKGASFDVQSPLIFNKNKDLRKTCSLPPHRKEGDVPSHWHSSVSHKDSNKEKIRNFSENSDNPLEILTGSENDGDIEVELANINNISFGSKGNMVADEIDFQTGIEGCVTPNDFDAETWLNDMTAISPLLTDMESGPDEEIPQQNNESDPTGSVCAETISLNCDNYDDHQMKSLVGSDHDNSEEVSTEQVQPDSRSSVSIPGEIQKPSESSKIGPTDSICMDVNDNAINASHTEYASCDSSTEDGNLIMDFSEDDDMKISNATVMDIPMSKSGNRKKKSNDKSSNRNKGNAENLEIDNENSDEDNQENINHANDSIMESAANAVKKSVNSMDILVNIESNLSDNKNDFQKEKQNETEQQNQIDVNPSHSSNKLNETASHIPAQTNTSTAEELNSSSNLVHTRSDINENFRIKRSEFKRISSPQNQPVVCLSADLSEQIRISTCDTANVKFVRSPNKSQIPPTSEETEPSTIQTDVNVASQITANETDDDSDDLPLSMLVDSFESKRKTNVATKENPLKSNSSSTKIFPSSKNNNSLVTSKQWITESSEIDEKFVINNLKDVNFLLLSHKQNKKLDVKFHKNFLPSCVFNMLKRSTGSSINIFQNDFNIYDGFLVTDLPHHECAYIKRMRLIQTTGICNGKFIEIMVLPLLLKIFMYFPQMAPCHFPNDRTATGLQLLSRLKSDFVPEGVDLSMYEGHAKTFSLVRVISFLCRTSSSLSSFYAFCRYCLIWQQGQILFTLLQGLLCWPKALTLYPGIGKSIIRIIKRQLTSPLIITDAEKVLELSRQVQWIEEQCSWGKVDKIIQMKAFDEPLSGIVEAKFSGEFEEFLRKVENGIDTTDAVLPITVFDGKTTLTINMFELLQKESTMEIVKSVVLDKLFWPILNKWSRHIHIHGDDDNGREVSNVCIVALIYTFSLFLSSYLLRQRHSHKTQHTLPTYQSHYKIICGMVEQFSTLYLEKAPRIVQCASASFLLRTCFVNPSNAYQALMKWVKATTTGRTQRHKHLSLVVAFSCCTEEKLKMICNRLDMNFSIPGEGLVSYLWPS
ncbi:uncharacterized protein LOC120335546 [Styela clava]